MAINIDKELWDSLDREVLADFRCYLYKFNEAIHYRAGLQDTFEEIPGISAKTEMAEPNITQTARYQYMARDLAFNGNMTTASQILNMLVTHVIGGHETPRAFSGRVEREWGFVDFERVAARDRDYIDQLESNALKMRAQGLAIWNDITIRSSVQGVANKYVDSIGSPRGYAGALEWMANWIADGTVDRLLDSETFQEATEILLEQKGIGKYIAFHAAAGISSHPLIRMGHEEEYALAGPGACRTIASMFHDSKVHPNDVCIWFAENQEKLVPDLHYHEYWHNIEVDGKGVYGVPQDRLFPITSEIALCLYNTFKKNRQSAKFHASRQKAYPDLDPMLKLIAV